jgi:hypothetical protein
LARQAGARAQPPLLIHGKISQQLRVLRDAGWFIHVRSGLWRLPSQR